MKFYVNECQIEVAIHRLAGTQWVWGYQVAGKRWGRDVLLPTREHMWSGNVYISAEVAMKRALMAIDIINNLDDEVNKKTRYLPDRLIASRIDPFTN